MATHSMRSVLSPSVVGFIALVYYIHLYWRKGGRPDFHYSRRNKRNLIIVARLIRSRYWPTPYLLTGYAQTVLGGIQTFHFGPKVKYQREIVNVSPPPNTRFLKGQIALDWLPQSDARLPTVVLIPGLTGDSGNKYIRVFANKFHKEGFTVCAVNYRASGGLAPINEQFYSASYTEDLRQAVDYIFEKSGGKEKLFLIGFSLGANLLSIFLSEEGDHAQRRIRGAAAISSPHDLLICSRRLSNDWMNRIFFAIPLARRLVRMYFQHKEVFVGSSFGVNLEKLKQAWSLREVDRQVVVKVFGFRTVDEYHRNSSGSAGLHNVRVPLLMLSSLDDPICTPEAIPYEEARLSDYVILATLGGGGHGMEWFSGIFAQNSFSADFALSFVNVVMTEEWKDA
eukprot:TRINITY_DN4221_c0_g1_i2.p1 TRINITY_DN4221_c0_g1~~TRINITY_DN4221_c0_g1_i2.p1  ORF type:complete len:396 (-),score=94.62 TRINITY_DN4221_c0_g1_i2:1028-2215(-)